MAEEKTKSKKKLLDIIVYVIICISVIVIVYFLNIFDMFSKAEFSTQDCDSASGEWKNPRMTL